MTLEIPENLQHQWDKTVTQLSKHIKNEYNNNTKHKLKIYTDGSVANIGTANLKSSVA